MPLVEVEWMSCIDDPEQFRPVPRQDREHIPRIQNGLHSDACKQVWFSDYREQTISKRHREPDRYHGAAMTAKVCRHTGSHEALTRVSFEYGGIERVAGAVADYHCYEKRVRTQEYPHGEFRAIMDMPE